MGDTVRYYIQKHQARTLSSKVHVPEDTAWFVNATAGILVLLTALALKQPVLFMKSTFPTVTASQTV